MLINDLDKNLNIFSTDPSQFDQISLSELLTEAYIKTYPPTGTDFNLELFRGDKQSFLDNKLKQRYFDHFHAGRAVRLFIGLPTKEASLVERLTYPILFIPIVIKNTIKAVVELAPYAIQKLSLKGVMWLRNGFSNKSISEKIFRGIGIGALGSLYFLSKGVRLLVRTFTSPVASMKEGFAKHWSLGIVSGILSAAGLIVLLTFVAPVVAPTVAVLFGVKAGAAVMGAMHTVSSLPGLSTLVPFVATHITAPLSVTLGTQTSALAFFISSTAAIVRIPLRMTLVKIHNTLLSTWNKASPNRSAVKVIKDTLTNATANTASLANTKQNNKSTPTKPTNPTASQQRPASPNTTSSHASQSPLQKVQNFFAGFILKASNHTNSTQPAAVSALALMDSSDGTPKPVPASSPAATSSGAGFFGSPPRNKQPAACPPLRLRKNPLSIPKALSDRGIVSNASNHFNSANIDQVGRGNLGLSSTL